MNENMLDNIASIVDQCRELENANIQILQLSLACKQIGVGMGETLNTISKEISEISRVLHNTGHRLRKEYDENYI